MSRRLPPRFWAFIIGECYRRLPSTWMRCGAWRCGWHLSLVTFGEGWSGWESWGPSNQGVGPGEPGVEVTSRRGSTQQSGESTWSHLPCVEIQLCGCLLLSLATSMSFPIPKPLAVHGHHEPLLPCSLDRPGLPPSPTLTSLSISCFLAFLLQLLLVQYTLPDRLEGRPRTPGLSSPSLSGGKRACRVKQAG